ncbi:MAG TPA: nucleotidyltransferase domain-containing protein, partial [bacterium]|nr:nucleotidyltransferase domain-containing protein [bacterium]
KRSAVQIQSFGSVTIAFLDRQAVIDGLRECAERLVRADPRVRAVGLFGSLARGDATPSSDADVLIVLSEHPTTPWFKRIPDYSRAFDGISLGVEPFPYTLAEIRNMLSGPGFMRTVIRELIPLAGETHQSNQLYEWADQAQ